MCGIVGLASSEGTKGYIKRRDFIHNSLYADALRGYHSTGLLLVPNKKDAEIILHKKAMPAGDFLETNRVSSFLTRLDDYKYVIGHNRHATKGAINSRMAHPFSYGDISLVHNGTLTSQYYLPKGSSFTSDSEAITYAIAQQGADKTIRDLDGAFALVWHDDSDDTLHMVRNEERPLCFAFVKNENTMLFASEKRMLEWISFRNNLDIDKIFNLNVGFELKFDAENLRDYKHTKHTLKKKVVYGGSSYNHYDDYPAGNTNRRVSNQANSTLPVVGKSIFEKNGLIPSEFYNIKVTQFVPFNPDQVTGSIYGYLKGSITSLDIQHECRVTGVNKDDWEWICEEDDGNNILYAKLTQSNQKMYRNNVEIPVFTAVNPELSKENGFMQQDDSDETEDQLTEESEGTLLIEGPEGILFSELEFEALVHEGCSNCTRDLYITDAPSIQWTSNSEPICAECAKDEELGITIH